MGIIITIIDIVQYIVIGGLYLYSLLWLAWIIMSWLQAFGVVQINPDNTLIRIVSAATDGVIDRVFGSIREKLIIGVIDISPFIFLFVVANILPQVLTWLFMLLKRAIISGGFGG
ncbi:MAG: YggT family protein [Spirochaetota bacterium]